MGIFIYTMLTYERANEIFRYDPDTGKIYWKVKPSKRVNINVGDEAGSLSHDNWNTYRQIKIDGKLYFAHRIVWLLHYGVWPDDQVDHVDGDGLNNRVENLRDVTNQDNAKNQRMRRNNTSGITGVFWSKSRNKWVAQIRINGKRNHIGRFDDKAEAAEVYRKTADALGFTDRHGK